MQENEACLNFFLGIKMQYMVKFSCVKFQTLGINNLGQEIIPLGAVIINDLRGLWPTIINDLHT